MREVGGGLLAAEPVQGVMTQRGPSVATVVPHPRGRAAADQDGGRAFGDCIWRPDTGTHAANDRRGQSGDEDGGHPGWENGPADVRDDPGHHGADVHIAYSGSGRHKRTLGLGWRWRGRRGPEIAWLSRWPPPVIGGQVG